MKDSQRTHPSHHTHVAAAHTHHATSHGHHIASHRHVHSTHGVCTHWVHAHVAATTAAVVYASTHVAAHHSATVEAAAEVVHSSHGVAEVVHWGLTAIASHIATRIREVAVLVAHAPSIEVASVVVIVIVVISASVVAALVTKVARCTTVIPALLSRRDIFRECLEGVNMRRIENGRRLLRVGLVLEKVLDLVLQGSGRLWRLQ